MNRFNQSLTKKLKPYPTSTSHSPSTKPCRNADTAHTTRRNERERNRVKLLNMGFDRLRAVVPCRSGEQLSKISTLKKAIWYIEHLDKKADDHDLKEHTSASFVHSTPQNRRVDKKNFCPNSNSPSSSSSSVFLLSCGVSNDSGYHSYQSQYESLLLSSAPPTHSTLSTWNNPNHNAGASMLTPPPQK
ncbi:unnamed protein product [Schistosoma turkestanicum]|nr:unnamed protein product [Schistosoma turkestanicum]